MATYVCITQPGPTFEPYITVISAITKAQIPTVTVTFAHNYVDGTIVRFVIPPACGMQQLNGLTSPVLIVNSTSFTIAIDTLQFDSFAIPVSPDIHINICALAVPMAEVSATLKAAVHNIL